MNHGFHRFGKRVKKISGIRAQCGQAVPTAQRFSSLFFSAFSAFSAVKAPFGFGLSRLGIIYQEKRTSPYWQGYITICLTIVIISIHIFVSKFIHNTQCLR